MSFLRCPLCGKLTSLRKFDPENFENDITIVEMQSQGRARGFKVVDEYSGLHDEDLISKISARIDILKKLIDKESNVDRDKIEDHIEELTDENKHLQTQLEIALIGINQLEDTLEENDDILEMINQALEDITDEEFTDLSEAVSALIIEFEEALEEAEG